MATTAPRTDLRAIHPLHAVLLAATVPLYLGGLLSDWAYFSTYEIQWSNFAAWLIAGAMVFTGFALLWSLIDLIGARGRRGRALLYFLLLLALFVIGLLSSFHHARDAWAVMPGGLIYSCVTAILAIAATWLGFSTLRSGLRSGAVR